MPPAPLDALRVASDATGRVVAGIAGHQWDDPTPCADWTVTDLTRHLVRGNDLFTAALRGEPAGPTDAADDSDGSDGSGSGPALAAAFRPGVDRLLAAFGTEGVLERTVTVPFGVVPGMVALHLRTTEMLVHGWDLARATGQQLDVPDDVAAAELRFSEGALQNLPPGRSPFGAPQPAPADASALDRLAALLGRRVAG